MGSFLGGGTARCGSATALALALALARGSAVSLGAASVSSLVCVALGTTAAVVVGADSADEPAVTPGAAGGEDVMNRATAAAAATTLTPIPIRIGLPLPGGRVRAGPAKLDIVGPLAVGIASVGSEPMPLCVGTGNPLPPPASVGDLMIWEGCPVQVSPSSTSR